MADEIWEWQRGQGQDGPAFGPTPGGGGGGSSVDARRRQREEAARRARAQAEARARIARERLAAFRAEMERQRKETLLKQFEAKQKKLRDEQERLAMLREKRRENLELRAAKGTREGQIAGKGAVPDELIAQNLSQLDAEMAASKTRIGEARGDLQRFGRPRQKQMLIDARANRKNRKAADRAWQKQIQFMATDKGISKMQERAKQLGIEVSVDQIKSGKLRPVELLALMAENQDGLSEMQRMAIRNAKDTVRKSVLEAPEGTKFNLGKGYVDEETGDIVMRPPSVGVSVADQELWNATDFTMRQDVIMDLYRTMNPFVPIQPDSTGGFDHIMTLLHDPDVRFKDPSGRRRKKDGTYYTIDDYLLGDVPLDLDTRSVNLIAGRPGELSSAALKKMRGDVVTKGIVTMSGSDATWYFVHMSTEDPERFKKFQQQMWDAGFYEDTPYKPGLMDLQTQQAMSSFLGQASGLGQMTNWSFETLLSNFSGQHDLLYGDSGFGGGGGGGASAWSVTDEAALNAIADTAGQTLLGRNLTEQERALVTGQIRAAENAEGQKQSGAIVSVDPQARAEDIVRKLFPDDSKAHDMAGAFDMFAGILGENMGLGQGGFGQSSIPTGTGGPVAPAAPAGGSAPSGMSAPTMT